jgi:uncharacterized protein
MNIQQPTANIEHPMPSASNPLGIGRWLLDVGCFLLILLVRLYRWTLSPAKTFLCGPLAQCRFTPSCSEYALEALKTHGALNGSWLAVRRIGRCHPWGDCGHDPVPERKSGKRKAENETVPAHCC